MPVEIVATHLADHPIAHLQYATETRVWKIADEMLNLTTLQNVENSIDQVIQWLESRGIAADEIENLAPYFGTVWPSAVALAAYLNQPTIKPWLIGKRSVELGCGLGIPSLIFSKAGGSCTVVDNHPSVPVFLQKNVAQNEPATLTFKSPQQALDDAKTSGIQYEWVIASDVLYDKSLVETFVQMISALAAPDARCVITDPGRAYIQAFVAAMNRAGWIEELISWTVPAHPPQFNKACDIFVLVFKHR
jgi:predicted nicotinamide N-methyase